MMLIYHYQRRSVGRTLALLALLGGWALLFASGALKRSHITVLYDFNNVLLFASRVPQILQSQATRSTGQLSIITYSLNVAGSAARIFTSIHEQAGAAMLRGAVISECPRARWASLPCSRAAASCCGTDGTSRALSMDRQARAALIRQLTPFLLRPAFQAPF